MWSGLCRRGLVTMNWSWPRWLTRWDPRAVRMLAVLALLALPLVPLLSGCGQSEEAKGTFRADLRAYYGAPPVIPHPVEALGRGNCRACHEQGLIYQGQVAVARPHPYVGECRQCHVEQLPVEPKVENSFVGLAEPEPIPPAYPGAPPPIPHDTRMRHNCNACHGPRGHPELRAPHPRHWTNCTQCHVSQEPATEPLVQNDFAALWEATR